jgi:rare lipoprotein A
MTMDVRVMHWIGCAVVGIALTCGSVSAEEAGTGMASFYAEVPDRSDKFTAAHRTLPFGTMVSVTRTDTGAHVVVRINDRGPIIKVRIIDVSHPAAQKARNDRSRRARVHIHFIPTPERASRRTPGQEADFRCFGCWLPILE